MRALLTAAAALAVAAPGASAAPSFSDGFGVRPMMSHGDAAAPSYFDIDGRPGQRMRQRVVMWNASERTVELLVDGVDGVTGTTSGAVYANAQDPHDETSRWIRPSTRHVTLEPGERRRYTFDVRIPDHAEPGEHLGGLAFQNAATPTTGSRFSVRQVLRIVLGVQVTIPGGARAQIGLGGVELRALPGTQVASAVMPLANEGQHSCKPRVHLALEGGGQRRSVDQQLDTILPGDRIAFPMPIRGRLPAGRYDVHTTVRGCGGERSTTSQVVLNGALSGTTPQPTSGRGATTPPPSLALWLLATVLVGGLAAGSAIAAWWPGRRRRQRDGREQWA